MILKMRKISILFLIVCLSFTFISCSENKNPYSHLPNVEIQQKIDPVYETGERTEPTKYKVTTYVRVMVFENYGNIIRSKYEYVSYEGISKIMEDQMVWALKAKIEYKLNLQKMILEYFQKS
jgi:hypothetical protein